MNNRVILIRYGEFMLKGKNQRLFKNKLQTHLKNIFKSFNLKLIIMHDKAQISNYNLQEEQVIISKLQLVSGLHSFSVGEKLINNDKEIINYVKDLINSDSKKNTYKIETKRLDKTIPFTSIEFSQRIAKLLHKKVKGLKLDVKNHNRVLHFELINKDEVIIYHNKNILLGGLPAYSQGRALGLISGGIDSPVASILMLKKGTQLELVHFESTPMTPLESIDKVFSLVSKLAEFCPEQSIKLHLIPFIDIHQAILKNVCDSYIITILRRMMYRCVDRLCDKYNILTISSGDSIGQVASQTLESLATVGSVTKYNIIRPLAGFDKEDIIKISKKYDLYDTAILPFEDCCTIYLPKNPATKPIIEKSLFWETKFDFDDLLNKAVASTITIDVKANTSYAFAKLGIDFKSSYEAWKNDRNNKQGK